MRYNQRAEHETLAIVYKLLQDKRFNKLTITRCEHVIDVRYDLESDEK